MSPETSIASPTPDGLLKPKPKSMLPNTPGGSGGAEGVTKIARPTFWTSSDTGPIDVVPVSIASNSSRLPVAPSAKPICCSVAKPASDCCTGSVTASFGWPPSENPVLLDHLAVNDSGLRVGCWLTVPCIRLSPSLKSMTRAAVSSPISAFSSMSPSIVPVSPSATWAADSSSRLDWALPKAIHGAVAGAFASIRAVASTWASPCEPRTTALPGWNSARTGRARKSPESVSVAVSVRLMVSDAWPVMTGMTASPSGAALAVAVGGIGKKSSASLILAAAEPDVIEACSEGGARMRLVVPAALEESRE